MIFSLRARGHVNRVGFYMIPYNRVRVVGVGSSNAGKHNFSCRKESYYVQANRGFATLQLCSDEDGISTNRII